MTRRSLVAIGRSALLYRTLEHLANAGYDIAGIVTDEANAEYGVGVDDFQTLAERTGAEFCLTKKITPGVVDTVAGWTRRSAATVAISANWRFIIPATLLSLFRDGVWNLHIGNLPDFKGNATANWSILTGESVTFANVHRMEAALDAGAIIARAPIEISSSTYVGEILAETERLAPGLFELALTRIAATPGHTEAPNGPDGIRCYPRLPEDGLIDWRQSAESVVRLVRASSRPYPGAFSYLDGRRVVIWRARPAATDRAFLAVPGQVLEIDRTRELVRIACGDGAVDLEEVEVDGVAVPTGQIVSSIRSRFSAGRAEERTVL